MNTKILHDSDIREPLFDFLEERLGKIRILEEKQIGRARDDAVMVTERHLYGIEIKSDAFTGSGLIGSNVPTIYVGQGDSHDDGSDVLKRMVGKHAEGVDEWDVGYAVTCGTPNLLDATALNWLERYFYDKACAVGRYQVLNSVRPPGKEPDIATKGVLMNFIEIAEYLLKRDLGLYAFEKVGYRNIPIGFSDSPLIGKQMFLSNAKAGVYAVGVMTG